MSKERLREGLIMALVGVGFIGVGILVFKIKAFTGVDPGGLSDEEISAITASIRYSVLFGGFIIGSLMGAVVQRSKFCIAAACHAPVTIGDLTQTRSYAMSLFVAILGTQMLYRFGQVEILSSIYISSPFTWLSYIVGGLIFGIGIVYAEAAPPESWSGQPRVTWAHLSVSWPLSFPQGRPSGESPP